MFDNYVTIDMGADLSINSDCGKINIVGTYRSALKNLLDAKYYGKIGTSILKASPMLLTCYYSPTWCAVLKHTRIAANFLSQLRLDQCSLIDKYVDKRAEDFYKERQTCVHKAIEKNGGNLEEAMDKCGNSAIDSFDLANWAGKENGEKKSSNKLVEDSLKWVGLDSEENKENIDFVKSLVGDIVVSKGKYSVEFGDRNFLLSPSSYLESIEGEIYTSLCKETMNKIDRYLDKVAFNKIIGYRDLKRVSGNSHKLLIDRQTLEYLAYMPRRLRKLACKKLANAIARTLFSNKMNETLNLLMKASQNPNLPANRKRELIEKSEGLKSSIEMTLELKKEKTNPLNDIMFRINQEGMKYKDHLVRKQMENDADTINKRKIRRAFMDCSDGIFCEGR